MMTYDDLDRAYHGPRTRQPGGWRMPCPAHRGKDSNCSVTRGSDDGAAIVCHSRGCDWRDIVDAIDPDLLQTPRSRPAPTKSARSASGRTTWTYRAADGTPVLRVVRHDHDDGSKSIRQERPDGAGGWRSGGASDVPLLGADTLAAHPGPLLIVEGEKAVDAVRGLGVTRVTCWAQGTSGLSKADLSAVRGRDVTLWADADDPGRKAMRRAAGRCYDAGAASVHLVLPDGTSGRDAADLIADGDITDPQSLAGWLAQHATAVTPDEAAETAPNPGGRPAADDVLPHDYHGIEDGLGRWGWQIGLDRSSGMRSIRHIGSIPIKPDRAVEYRGVNRRFKALMGGRPDLWHPLTESLSDLMREQFADHWRYRNSSGNLKPWRMSAERWRMAVNAVASGCVFDPLDDWLAARRADVAGLDTAPADPSLAVASIWCHTNASHGETEAVAWAIRCMMSTVIARAAEPGLKQRQVPILLGLPDDGKTTVWELLAPLGRYGDVRLDGESEASRRDVAELMRSCTVVNCDEMAGLRADRVETAKAIMTGTVDAYSPKYVREVERAPRRCAVVGTSNHGRRVPADAGVMARMMLVDLPERPQQALEDTLPPARVDELWAWATWHHDHASPAWQRTRAGLIVPGDVRARCEAAYMTMVKPSDRGMMDATI